MQLWVTSVHLLFSNFSHFFHRSLKDLSQILHFLPSLSQIFHRSFTDLLQIICGHSYLSQSFTPQFSNFAYFFRLGSHSFFTDLLLDLHFFNFHPLFPPQIFGPPHLLECFLWAFTNLEQIFLIFLVNPFVPLHLNFQQPFLL